jgi:DNA-binding NarL/FixJ family response regulator
VPEHPAVATAAVVETAEVIARGLASFTQEALAGASVRVVPDPAVLRPGSVELVVCGPSCVTAFLDLLMAAAPAARGYVGDQRSGEALQSTAADRPAAPRALVVVHDLASVDFAAMLLAGVEVAWDLRSPFATFAAAAAAAARGDSWVSESLTGAMASDIGLRLRRGQEAANFGLTAREAEVLRLMATGLANRDIAERLFISVNTVKNHVRAVLDKLHAGSRTEAVMIGARVGLVDLDLVRAR